MLEHHPCPTAQQYVHAHVYAQTLILKLPNNLEVIRHYFDSENVAETIWLDIKDIFFLYLTKRYNNYCIAIIFV